MRKYAKMASKSAMAVGEQPYITFMAAQSNVICDLNIIEIKERISAVINSSEIIL